MRKMLAGLLLMILMTVSSAVSATPPDLRHTALDVSGKIAAPTPTSRSLDIEPFRFLLGRWHGQGKFAGSEKPLSSTMTFAVANGNAIEIHAAENAPGTYAYVAVWSKESGSDQILMLMSSNLDGAALYRSAGWVGDRMIFDPDSRINTGSGSVRFTYTRIGNEAFELTYEYSVNGIWHVGDKQRFIRSD